MPVPSNTTSGTAVDITSLPYSIVQSGIHDSGTTYDVWYKHTPAVSGMLGVWGLGSANLTTYRPTVSVYTNPAGAATITYQNRPIQFWGTAGTTYYFKFAPNAGNPNPATLTLSVLLHQSQTVPSGSIAVCDTVNTYPLALMPIDQDNTVLAFVQTTPIPFTATEYGADILPNGVVAIGDNAGDIVLWDANYNNIAFTTTTLGDEIVNVTTNRSDTFYVSTGYPYTVSAAVVTTISSTGVQGGTTWTLDETDVIGIAVSPDETILYYVTNANNSPVQRWDLVNDVALSDLAAGVNANTHALRSILCLSDGTVLVGYRNSTAGTEFVRQYSAAGATLNTYSLDYSTSDVADFLMTDVTEANFWVWQHDGLTTNSTMYFNQIRISDGTILNRVTGASFDAGRYMYSETLTPIARFGFSKSCPAWITRSSITPTPPAYLNGPAALEYFEEQGFLSDGNYPIVRVRRAPHLADEQQRVFYKKFQLDLEAGVGLTTGQGSDPILQVRWSNDGGFTWSGWRTLQNGKVGQYRWRAIAYQLGMSRDRVFEVRQSDPVKSVWLTAYLELEEGAN